MFSCGAFAAHPSPISQDLRKLISQCWHADVDRRPNFRTIAERLRALYNAEKHSGKLCMSALNLNEDPHPRGAGGACLRQRWRGAASVKFKPSFLLCVCVCF